MYKAQHMKIYLKIVESRTMCSRLSSSFKRMGWGQEGDGVDNMSRRSHPWKYVN